MFGFLLKVLKIRIGFKIMKIIIKRLFIPLTILSLIGIAFYTFNIKKNKEKTNDNVLILTTVRPLTIALNEICKDVSNISIKEITNGYLGSHSCFHDFSLTTKQVNDIEKSSLVVINGVSFEPFLKNIKNKNLIDSSENIEIIENKKEKNPWIWMSIQNYIKQISNIFSKFVILKEYSNLNPENRNKISENFTKYKENLEKIYHEWKTKFEKFKGYKVLTISNEFDYLLKEFDLEPIHLIEEHSHGGLSPKNISDSIKTIEDGQYKFYLSSSDKYCKIFEQTGAKCVKLDLIKSQDKTSYIEESEKNLNLLLENLNEFYK